MADISGPRVDYTIDEDKTTNVYIDPELRIKKHDKSRLTAT